MKLSKVAVHTWVLDLVHHLHNLYSHISHVVLRKVAREHPTPHHRRLGSHEGEEGLSAGPEHHSI